MLHLCREPKGQMKRLQKFVERGAYGEGPGRTAYALDPAKLPDPLKWRVVDDFKPGEAILANQGLKSVFQRALEYGVALVSSD